MQAVNCVASCVQTAADSDMVNVPQSRPV